MALSGKIIRRVTRTKTKDVIHSSGFAQVQSGSGFGATSVESFKHRQSIEGNRHLIQGYHRAHVAQSVNRIPKARSFDKAAPGAKTTALHASGASAHQKMAESRANRQTTARRFEIGAKVRPKTGGRRD